MLHTARARIEGWRRVSGFAESLAHACGVPLALRQFCHASPRRHARQVVNSFATRVSPLTVGAGGSPPRCLTESAVKAISKERLTLALLALIAAGIAPNLFPAAQAGLAKLSDLALWLLLPSIALLILVIALTFIRQHRVLGRRMIVGIASGIVATFGLEVVRTTSFRLGGMPGDLPRLLGVLITDRFMLGPSTFSDVLGYSYHFWNGACFGLIFAVVLGRRALRWPVTYGLLIGIGFLASPAVQAMGVGFFALQMPAMIATVFIAHLVYGLALGLLLRRLLPEEAWISRSDDSAMRLQKAGLQTV